MIVLYDRVVFIPNIKRMEGFKGVRMIQHMQNNKH